MKTLSLGISGMSCGHCTRAVTEALQGVDGVTLDSVEIGQARLHFDPARTSPDTLVAAVEEEGYSVTSVAEGS
jgi:copper chaperone